MRACVNLCVREYASVYVCARARARVCVRQPDICLAVNACDSGSVNSGHGPVAIIIHNQHLHTGSNVLHPVSEHRPENNIAR